MKPQLSISSAKYIYDIKQPDQGSIRSIHGLSPLNWLALLIMVDYLISFLLLSAWQFFSKKEEETFPTLFLLSGFYWESPPSQLWGRWWHIGFKCQSLWGSRVILLHVLHLVAWLNFCWWTSRGDHSKPFLLLEFFCGTPALLHSSKLGVAHKTLETPQVLGLLWDSVFGLRLVN